MLLGLLMLCSYVLYFFSHVCASISLCYLNLFALSLLFLGSCFPKVILSLVLLYVLFRRKSQGLNSKHPICLTTKVIILLLLPLLIFQ